VSTPVRIVLRPIGSPLTIGMSGLAIASLVESGMDLGWVPKSQGVEVGLILSSVPFLLQLLASIFPTWPGMALLVPRPGCCQRRGWRSGSCTSPPGVGVRSPPSGFCSSLQGVCSCPQR
jgi:hypothetical protein